MESNGEASSSNDPNELIFAPDEIPEATVGSFKHAALDHTAPSIRLIRIHPDTSPEGYIRCEVQHTTVDSTYICLSYVWGPADRGRWITMNGDSFWVRENLWHFLESARRKQRLQDQWLWIDALCIHQANNAERSHQVQQMGRIFSGAQEVISWLGTSDNIAEFLEWVSTRVKVDNNERCTIQEYVERRVGNFSHSEYWSRAWITQEILLARRRILMAKDKEMDMDVLFNTRMLYTESWCRILDNLRNLKGKNLIYLLAKFRYKECHIPRDRIFSLLALCGEASDIQVDYQVSNEELAFNILKACRTWFCMCTIRFVCEALRMLSNHPPEQSNSFEELLVARITVLGHRTECRESLGRYSLVFIDGSGPLSSTLHYTPTKTHVQDAPSSFRIPLQYLCEDCTGYLEMCISPSDPSFSYNVRYDGLSKTKTVYRKCGFSIETLSDGGICNIRFSLGFLHELSQIGRNGQESQESLCNLGRGRPVKSKRASPKYVLELSDPERKNGRFN